jgi:membrane protein DedA with SNARE-associated domain
MSAQAFSWCASIFLWSCLTGIGLPPVPEEAGILYAASVTALNSDVPWWLAWPAVSSGIIAADLILYGIGRLWGKQVLQSRWVNHFLAPERRNDMENRFHQHGIMFLLMARLLPPLRTGVFIIAGTIHYSLLRFLVADVCYGIVGVGLVFFGGTGLMSLIHQVGNWMIFALALVVIGVFLLYYYRSLRKLEVKTSQRVLQTVEPLIPAVESAQAKPDEQSVEVRH